MGKLGMILLLKLGVLGAFLFTLADTSGIPVGNPWFDFSVGYFVFSAVAAGMPEPEQTSSFGYIWMYRTFHILSANGTAYFMHKKSWDAITGRPSKDAFAKDGSE